MCLTTILAPTEALRRRALADARASGVTAANVTVCEVGNGPDRFEKVAEIASVEHELNEHPDFFLKVQRASDLTLAKSTARLVATRVGCTTFEHPLRSKLKPAPRMTANGRSQTLR